VSQSPANSELLQSFSPTKGLRLWPAGFQAAEGIRLKVNYDLLQENTTSTAGFLLKVKERKMGRCLIRQIRTETI
jgi:hypothetical protein